MATKKISSNHLSSKLDAGSIIAFAAAGGLIGAAAAYLISPKAKRTYADDLYDAYLSVKHKIEEAGEGVMEKGGETCHAAAEYAEHLKECACKLCNNTNTKLLLLGLISGSVLGAASFFLIGKNSEGQPLTEKVGSTLKNIQAIDWARLAKEFTGTLNNQTHAAKEEIEEEYEEIRPSSTLQDVIEIASVGARLWKSLKNRR